MARPSGNIAEVSIGEETATPGNIAETSIGRESAPSKEHYIFISYLRFIACAMILWDHLIALRYPRWLPVRLVRA